MHAATKANTAQEAERVQYQGGSCGLSLADKETSAGRLEEAGGRGMVGINVPVPDMPRTGLGNLMEELAGEHQAANLLVCTPSRRAQN